MSLSPPLILLADDDAADRLLAQDALEDSAFPHQLRCVEDGQELLDYLLERGEYARPHHAPRPDLILLDLNMPRKNGHEALEEIKANPRLCEIPVVMFSTSRHPDDLHRAYAHGVGGFIAKPMLYAEMVAAMKTLGAYWFGAVHLPPAH